MQLLLPFSVEIIFWLFFFHCPRENIDMKFQLRCLNAEFCISKYAVNSHSRWMEISPGRTFSVGPSDTRYEYILKLNIVIWRATTASRIVFWMMIFLKENCAECSKFTPFGMYSGKVPLRAAVLPASQGY